MNSRDARERLIDIGIQLFLERGFHATGLKDLLTEAGVPKGSFYHYFRSKEDFGLQIVDTYGQSAREFIDRLMADSSRSPIERVRRFFELAFTEMAESACRHGCLMGTLGQELADVSEAFRRAIHAHLEQWASHLAVGVAAAVAAGELPEDTDPQAYARLLIDGFQGAALRMRLEQGTASLERFMHHFFDTELAA